MLFYILKQRKGSRYRPMKHLLHLRSPLFVGILETTEIHDMNFTSFFLDELFHDLNNYVIPATVVEQGQDPTIRDDESPKGALELERNVQRARTMSSLGALGMPRWPFCV